LFAKIQFCLSNSVDEYDRLQGNIDLLQAALQAQSSYITIHQIELSSQGTKQQEFYNYTYTQLQEDPDAQYLRVNIQNTALLITVRDSRILSLPYLPFRFCPRWISKTL
jgi:hypothetical protein